MGVADVLGPEQPQVPYYELIVKSDGDVDASSLEAATGMRCTPLDRLVRLDGELVDEAALHGVIVRVYRLGLDLRALEQRSGHHAT